MAKATLVLLDEQDVPVAVGSVEHRYRVEGDVYAAANLAIPLRGRTAKTGAVRGIAGMQTVTIGGPMGSSWGMYMHTKSPYPIESLLAGDDPQVWRRGLAVLDDEAGTSSLRRHIHNPDDPTIDQKTWGAIHRALRPHSDHLADPLSQSRGSWPACTRPPMPAGWILGGRAIGGTAQGTTRCPGRRRSRRGRDGPGIARQSRRPSTS